MRRGTVAVLALALVGLSSVAGVHSADVAGPQSTARKKAGPPTAAEVAIRMLIKDMLYEYVLQQPTPMAIAIAGGTVFLDYGDGLDGDPLGVEDPPQDVLRRLSRPGMRVRAVSEAGEALWKGVKDPSTGKESCVVYAGVERWLEGAGAEIRVEFFKGLETGEILLGEVRWVPEGQRHVPGFPRSVLREGPGGVWELGVRGMGNT